MVCKFPQWSILWFVSYHKKNDGRVMVGNISLWNSMVVKLPLRNFLWLVSYHYGTFYGCKFTIMELSVELSSCVVY